MAAGGAPASSAPPIELVELSRSMGLPTRRVSMAVRPRGETRGKTESQAFAMPSLVDARESDPWLLEREAERKSLEPTP